MRTREDITDGRHGNEVRPRVLVLYYSSYGHIAALAAAVAEGAGGAGAEIAVKRVPELVPVEVARRAGYDLTQEAPVAAVAELADYDAIVIGTPTRFGNMAAQMKNFLDQAGGLWARDALVGKVGAVFTSTGSQHGGQETTILTAHVVMMHLGMVVVGLPYTFKGQLRMDEITGGSPYGASTLADDGSGGDRRPSENELAGARFQGRHVAEIAGLLAIGRARRDIRAREDA
ncbi:NAD(P)H dehydrogenase (quinone) [Chelatococcus caeni]|uniref:NAD(P)H dehydrogenase (quinone) n=1 Tax=Chelatococcus caeni TaxID=1348468 RepID=A0A840C7L0_9HYPH|nr:NAD(P)H:quinone oxidoreductase [Chelatococcus caeni]MBB4018886.1 NAD(P)H dehydrogenase (quinone) [Chelatococcus caeni]